MNLNEVETTMLTLVAEGARSVGDLEHVIETRGLRDWLRLGGSTVHYVLGMLEKQGLVTRQGEGSAALYDISEAGRGVLHTSITDLLHQPNRFGSGFALGLANLNALKPVQVYRALRHYRANLAEQLLLAERLWAIQQSTPSVPDQTRALYTHGIAMMRAELSWLEGFIADWRARYPAVEHDAATDTQEGRSAPTQVHSATVNKAKQMQRIPRQGK
jgi:DNA-binding PadR family transcriptional regulator